MNSPIVRGYPKIIQQIPARFSINSCANFDVLPGNMQLQFYGHLVQDVLDKFLGQYYSQYGPLPVDHFRSSIRLIAKVKQLHEVYFLCPIFLNK